MSSRSIMHARLIQLVATMLLAVQALGAALPAGLAACACMPASSKPAGDSASVDTRDEDEDDDACCCTCGCCGEERSSSAGVSGDHDGSPASPAPRQQHHHDDACGGCVAVNVPVESATSVVLDQAMQQAFSMSAVPSPEPRFLERDETATRHRRPPPRPPAAVTAASVLSSTRLII